MQTMTSPQPTFHTIDTTMAQWQEAPESLHHGLRMFRATVDGFHLQMVWVDYGTDGGLVTYARRVSDSATGFELTGSLGVALTSNGWARSEKVVPRMEFWA